MALCPGDTTESDLHRREARVGDRYLLCTDGLHGVLPEGRLHHALEATSNPQDTVDLLCSLVHDVGAPDNVACLVTDVLTPS
ncbi:MAG: hypothetical protein JO285_09850 [Kutzneria sp.]|nr:hypothetical protein [Kutzneria sp.]